MKSSCSYYDFGRCSSTARNRCGMYVFFGLFFQKTHSGKVLQATDSDSSCIDFKTISFNGKEKDYESGFHYYGARYYWSEVLTGWLSVDPMMDKYPSMSPYNYCAWNPVNVIDPSGMDSINVTYNSKSGKWDLSKPVIVEGVDVINVTGADGTTTSYSFSEGTYGDRICSLRLEDNGNQTLGVFLLSGEGVAGFSVEPSGTPDNKHSTEEWSKAHPVECGTYNIGSVTGPKWSGWPEFSNPNLNLKARRGVAAHYADNPKYETVSAKKFTTKCMVVSSAYTLDGGTVRYNCKESKAMAQKVAKYCGATSFMKRPGQYDKCIGINNPQTTRTIKSTF